MANVIKHKRGSGSDPSASNLVIGELAIRTDNGKLFTKMDSGSIAEIAGGGSDIAINTLSSSSATGGGSATFNGSAYRFTLSSPPSVSAAQLLVSVNGVIQKPVAGTGQPSEGFSVSGNDIIFGDAPATGADFFILTFRSLGVSEPAANSVTNAKVASNAAIAGTKISPNFGSQDITGSSLTINSTTPIIDLAESDGNPDYRIYAESGAFVIRNQSSIANRFVINSDGHIDLKTNVDCEAGLDVTGDITSTGNITIADSIIHSGDTNTKIRFPANDTISFETGGNERFKITSSGNVHINGTPPWSVTGGDYRNLSISGEGASASGFLWLGNGSATTNADFDLARINFNNGATITSSIRASTQTSANDDGRLTLHTKATGGSLSERVRIVSNGEVGIGLTDPQNYGLSGHGYGGLTVQAPSGGYSGITIRSNYAGGGILAFADGSGSNAERKNLALQASHVNKRLDILVDGSGVARFTEHGFHPNPADSSASTALDDYEEGTFSFTKRGFAGGFSTNYALANQTGKYTKIGRLVTLKGGFSLSGNSGNIAASNYFTVYISSLPFAMDDTSSGSSGAIISHQGTWWAYTSLGGGSNAKGSVIAVYNDYLSFYCTSVTGSPVRNNNEITFTITYTSS